MGRPRLYKVWDGTDWDNGYVDNSGHMRVYRPDYPNCYSAGYAFRSHIVWWLNTGQVVPTGNDYLIHHEDLDKLNDKFYNLRLKTRGEHTVDHQKFPDVEFVCTQCKETFIIPDRVYKNAVKSPGRRRKYCSRRCFYNSPRKQNVHA